MPDVNSPKDPLRSAKEKFDSATLEQTRLISVTNIPASPDKPYFWQSILQNTRDHFEASNDGGPANISYLLCKECSLWFPPGHPIAGQVYVRHPIEHEMTDLNYYPFDQFHKFLFEEKLYQAVDLLQMLGARRMALTQQGRHKQEGAKSVTAETHEVNLSASRNRKVRADADISFAAEIDHVTPTADIPSEENLIRRYSWYQSEKSWQAVVSARRNNHTGKFKISVTYSDDFGINWELRTKVFTDTITASGSFTTTDTYTTAIECDFSETPSPTAKFDALHSSISIGIDTLSKNLNEVKTHLLEFGRDGNNAISDIKTQIDDISNNISKSQQIDSATPSDDRIGDVLTDMRIIKEFLSRLSSQSSHSTTPEKTPTILASEPPGKFSSHLSAIAILIALIGCATSAYTIVSVYPQIMEKPAAPR